MASKKQSEISKAAKKYAGFTEDKVIDGEERYYNTHKCELYDAFLAGARANEALTLNIPGIEEV